MLEIIDAETIDKCDVLKEMIDSGGQSKVHKVNLDQHYALKLLNFNTRGINKLTETEIKKKLERIHKILEIILNLNHPNIVRVFGFSYGSKGQSPCILLQLCRDNLGNLIPRMNDVEKVCAIYEICSGMEAIHGANIIHRDLKPQNILIDSQKHVRISDFIHSCYIDLNNQVKTLTNLGAIAFMAPELLDQKEYTNKVDVYAFGVVLFMILNNGKMPQISPADQLNGKKASIPNNIFVIARDLIFRCWAYDPEERPSFAYIVNYIKRKKFELIRGVDKNINEIKEFLSL